MLHSFYFGDDTPETASYATSSQATEAGLKGGPRPNVFPVLKCWFSCKIELIKKTSLESLSCHLELWESIEALNEVSAALGRHLSVFLGEAKGKREEETERVQVSKEIHHEKEAGDDGGKRALACRASCHYC